MTEQGVPKELQDIISQLDQQKAAIAHLQEQRGEFNRARAALMQKAERVLHEKGEAVHVHIGVGAGRGLIGARQERISLYETQNVVVEQDGALVQLQLRQRIVTSSGYMSEHDGFELHLVIDKNKHTLSVGNTKPLNFLGEPLKIDDIRQADGLVDFIDSQLPTVRQHTLSAPSMEVFRAPDQTS